MSHQILRAQLSPRLSFFLSVRKSKNYIMNYVNFILKTIDQKEPSFKLGSGCWERHPRGQVN
ncbi:hypothetical protein, partial [Acinetobacter pittii]|uniref:hypothetical protein n=1 Tax=Acinetobacter pittii TaxID=48296 RepID=UPI001BC8739B